MELIGYPSIVIVGLWNRRIIMPEWFQTQFPELPKIDIPVEMELNSGIFRFTIEDIEINPQENKLILFAKKRENRTYALVEALAEGTVKELSHTPFLSIGHNIEYSVMENEKFTLFPEDIMHKAEIFYKEKAGALALTQDELMHRISYEHYSLNLTHLASRKEKKLLFNYHYPTNQYQKIIEYIKDFRRNIEHSKQLASNLVK